ncbi:glycosyl hydrolase [Dysgonomonas sp. Marseille-P4677]|uniref:glycoside hydrolase n=1 Tax=Dysgonomonas sp. Marseille-P4677 TaxID=2364790 RepID=UPI001912FD9F|nr:glycoside hydrolase [Dysgonomonas sp. Marseille-P4677]MBK5721773.1 glycosyl hydrolase [Dysgonomonas sp. Marseille-P4677]
MKFKFMSLAFILGLSLTATISCSQVEVPPPPEYSDIRTMKVIVDQEMQTMDGFGASDAWRCQMVGKNWPLEKRNMIADFLFSKEVDTNGNPKGIGLSIWRFYLGAGSTEQGPNSDITDEWRRGECFQTPDGNYDWEKQEGQRWFLQAAKKRGVDKLLAFTISAPVHMTINGKAFSPQKINMNIKEGKLPDYADFLVECIDNLQKKEGIRFDYLSPINEPQWDWMAGSNGKASQEGTPATNQEIFEFTSLLSERLKKKSLSTQIVLGEAGAINYLYENVNNETRDDQINDFWNPSSSMCIASLPNVMNVITGHSYFSVWPINDQVQNREKLNAKVKQFSGLKYWQTEYCILEQPGESEIPGGGGGKRDLEMKTALFVARIIHNDLVVANASSWQWWTALTRADYKDGLIYLDDGNSTGSQSPEYCKNDGYVRDSKLMWAFGNFSFFIRPDMVRIQVADQNATTASSDIMISAYKDKQSQKLVIVAINVSDTERTYKLDINGKVKNNELTPYVTSGNSNLKKGEKANSEKMIIPAKSVVTFVGELQ